MKQEEQVKLEKQLQANAKTLQKKLTALKAKSDRAMESYEKAISVYRELADITPRTKDIRLKLNKAIANKEKKLDECYYLDNEIYRTAVELSDIEKELGYMHKYSLEGKRTTVKKRTTARKHKKTL